MQFTMKESVVHGQIKGLNQKCKMDKNLELFSPISLLKSIYICILTVAVYDSYITFLTINHQLNLKILHERQSPTTTFHVL